jgi:PAS domain S-box-containing protein
LQEPVGVLAASQRAIVNVYTMIALLYCAASSWLFYQVVGLPSVGLVHLVALAVISANYLLLQVTRNYGVATHVILAVGTLVVSSLYATGGWEDTGFLWTFAYLPYAFFLASERVATLWVGILVVVDLVILAGDLRDVLLVPYDGIEHGMFYASLGVFLLCMFLFKREVLSSEAKANQQARDLAKANEQLSKSEADLMQAQRTARLGSWSWEPATDRTTWSPQMDDLYGLKPGDPPLNLDSFRKFIHAEDAPRVLAAVQASITQGLPLDADYRIVRRDGAIRTIHSRATPQKDAAGNVVSFIGTSQDVTELRQAEDNRRLSAVRLQEIEGLKEVNRFKTQFLNTAAHELATPLTPIRLQLHNLKTAGTSTSPEKRQHALQMLERNIDRLGALVNDLLEGARLQSNQLAIERKPVDLAKVLDDAVRNQVVANEKGVRIAAEPSGPLWTLGDVRRLSQVVDNLLSNAVKFTPAGKTVRVRALHASGGVAVFVEDEGIGISPEGQAKLFQPFSQVHDTSQQTRAGTGLGLYISKGIVEAHGGRIGVESAGLGKGTKFWFVLGAGDPPAGAA